jgi:hypothetical protein
MPPAIADHYNSNHRNNNSSGHIMPQNTQQLRRNPTQHADVEVGYENGDGAYDGPVDLDELFMSSRNVKDTDDDSLFDEDDDTDEYTGMHGPEVKYFNNPHKRLLDNDASLIPGSPFSKPAIKRSNRPKEPLAMARVRRFVYYWKTFCFCFCGNLPSD